MNGARGRAWALAAGLPLLFIACSWTTEHYWDEYYYLFSVSRHSVATLLTLEPALSDGIFPNGFFSGKLGFVVLLRGVVSMLGDGPSAILATRILFTLMMIGTAVATWLLMRAFVNDRRLAIQAAALLLLAPLTVYLGFKVMSEVPSLLAATLAGWQFVETIRTSDSRLRSRGLALAAIGFAAAMLFRLTSALFVGGIIVASLISRPGGMDVRRVITDAAIVCAGTLALSAAVLMLTVDAPLARFGGLAESVTGRSPGAIVVLYALALFAQLVIILVVAALRPMTRLVAGALAWLAIALLPYVITAQYVEPRYFFTGLPPFALLAAIGLNNLVTRAPAARRPVFAAVIAVSLVVVDRALFAGVMPYEIRESDYGALVEHVDESRPQATLVAPWLSDFCYLSTAFPGRRVALSMSQTYGTGTVFQSPEFLRWAGAANYVADSEDLEKLPAPRVYVGWEYSPTVEALDRYLSPLSLGYLDNAERRARLLNHLTPSWLWHSPQYRLTPIATEGAYRAFAIEERHGS